VWYVVAGSAALRGPSKMDLVPPKHGGCIVALDNEAWGTDHCCVRLLFKLLVSNELSIGMIMQTISCATSVNYPRSLRQTSSAASYGST